MKKGDLIIHVGLPRSGSTFIQKKIFKRLNMDKYYIRGTNFGGLNIETPIKKDKINIFTKESLSNIRRSYDKNCRFKNIDRLKILFPDAKILFIHRDDTSFRKSIYKMMIQEGYHRSYEEFIEKIKKMNHYLSNDIYYDKLVDNFDCVKRIEFKLLLENKKRFVEEIYDFIGCDIIDGIDMHPINKSWNDNRTENARSLNRYFKSTWNKHALLPRKLNPYAFIYKIGK